MVQLSFQRSITPDTLTIRVHQDPHDPTDPLVITAQVWAVDDTLLAAKSVSLVGIEADFADSIVKAVLECWQWGSPQHQLPYVMRRIHKQAQLHRLAHQRS